MANARWALFVLLGLTCSAVAQQSAPPAARQDRNRPELSRRPPPKAKAPQGRIRLDVVVTDPAGEPVPGLTQQDFTLLDNKKPQPILSFRAVDGVLGAGPGEPPVEVILLIDVMNTSLRVVGNERYQIENFLRRNGGKLALPTSLMIFDDYGVKVDPQPTRDGNLLASKLNQAEATIAFHPVDDTA